MEEMNRNWGLQCLYGKAWQAKEYVESFVFGPPEKSFQLLPFYFHMLERENPDIVTAVMRPVITIDATHLKGRFKGILFVAQLGIRNVVEKVYKDAHHGLCNYHLRKNVKNRFKHEDVATIFTMAANFYRVTDFDRHMNQLKQLCKPAYDNLIRLGLERWAHARAQCIRGMFQRWFHDRHNEALNLTTPLNPWATDLLNKRFNEACHFSIQTIDRVEFQVIGGSKDRVVNLSTKECSCGEFQSDLLPCTHAMVAISKCKRAAIEFCSDYYKTRSWAKGYAVPIRPVGHLSEWDIPDDVQQIIILPPSWRGQAGKSKRKRIASVGEGSRRCRFSQCKSYGHNRQNCQTQFAAPLTNRETSSAQQTARLRRPKACAVCRQPKHTRNHYPMWTTNSDNVIGVIPEDSGPSDVSC
ncbi:PREDICTED: uncharacterized protein LOC108662415 [Theobroma cacao]|uniref:Uncharacterized protein LOC108662415 n=1 Tax=Theobroma cacao TaxID=3641 RepID=A0AB32WJW4_THECC|nr:PREDICTED: uncharacterized protein LOC108662415 [Theobroma cacao]